MSINVNGLPTSCDIWLELDGKKVAVVQSYHCKTSRNSTSVEAFGEDEPVAIMDGPQQHVIQLKRLYATDKAIAANAKNRLAMTIAHDIVKKFEPEEGQTDEGRKKYTYKFKIVI